MRGSHENGFTLIELLVVLGVLGLIAAFAVPVAARTIDGVMLQTDARALVVALRRLKTEAIDQQETISVTLAEDKMLASSGEALNAPNGGVLKFSDTTKRIAFFADGTSSGGKFSVAHGDQSLDVDIGWLSGEVSVADQ